MAPSTAVFAGTGIFAATILQTLLDDGVVDVRAVLTALQDKSNDMSLVATLAVGHTLPAYTPTTSHDIETTLRSLSPDVLIVADYGHILSRDALAIPKHGAINVHPSLLPKYRGPAPLQHAILNGDPDIGLSIILMDEQMDHGPLLAQETLAPQKNEMYQDLLVRAARESGRLLVATLRAYLTNDIQPMPQDHGRATKHSFLTRQDGSLRLNESSSETLRRFRALSPWPGLWADLELNGKRHKIKFTKLDITSEPLHSALPHPLSVQDNELYLRTVDGGIRILELQIDGKKPLPSKDFINGYRLG